METETKVCTSCNDPHPLSEFPSNGKRIRSQCRKCRNKIDAASKRKRLQTDPIFRAKENIKRLKRAQRNRPHVYELAQKHYRRGSIELSDSYVRGILAKSMGVGRPEVPAGLIEIKRLHLRLIRTIREASDRER